MMTLPRAHIVVVANAKGGSGKSTTAMHVAMRLLAEGRRVALVDLDGRQQTLTRYFENRALFARTHKLDLPMPLCAVLEESGERNATAAHEAEYTQLCTVLERLLPDHHVVVVDCPGADTYLARVAHGFADTLLTPLNDSFIDVDLLAHIDADSLRMESPSWYSEMVWEQRKRRKLSDGHSIDWVVLRNRLSHTDAGNKRNVQQVLGLLAPHLGFRQVAGLGERVIFRELFLKGLTLSDVRAHKTGVTLTMNHVAAHQEVRDLVAALRLPPLPAAATG